MKRVLSFAFIISFVSGQLAYAETGISTYSSPPPPPAPTNMNVNKTAKQTSSTATIMKTANMAAGAAFLIKATAAPPPKKPTWYALAAASLGMAMVMGGGSKNANNIDRATSGADFTGGSGPTGYNNGETPDLSQGGYSDPALDALERQLRDAGYGISSDGSMLSLPDGSSVSTQAIANGEVPGFDLAGVKSEADQIMDEALKKASGNKVVPIALNDAGGGGGGSEGAAAPEEGSRFSMADYLKSLRNRDPSSVNGLSKKLGDDNIGIKSDNIFDMVSRQYKRKQSQRAFVN